MEQPGAARSSQKQAGETRDSQQQSGAPRGSQEPSGPRTQHLDMDHVSSSPRGLVPEVQGIVILLAIARPGEMPPSGGGGVNNHLISTIHSRGRANRSYASCGSGWGRYHTSGVGGI